MKRIFKLLIMVGVLVILASVYLIITLLTGDNKAGTQNPSDTSISTTYTAAQVDIKTVYAIKYNIDDVKYVFTLNETETAWLWDSTPELPLDNQYFAAMATALQSVTSTTKMLVSASALSTYGLDTPWLTVSVSDETYGCQTFMFGDLNSFNNQYYFMTGSDSDAVYMVSASIPASFSYTPYEMILNDTIPSIPADSILGVTFTSAGDTRVYTYYENGKDDSAETSDNWYLSTNGEAEIALDEEIGAGICNAISSMSFTELVGKSEAERNALGLNEPTVMTVSYVAEKTVADDTTGNTTTISVNSKFDLNLGYSDGKGGIYACLDSSILSYRIDGSLLATLYDAIVSPGS